MSKEIGGYIELDDINGEEYHNKAIALNSGRHCLEYLIKAKHIEKIYIPYFLCSSIKEVCEKCNCKYEYYHIDENFNIQFDKSLFKNEYIYIVNYYGQLQEKAKIQYENKYKNIIIDNAQAFFDKPMENIDTLYTCRKFFGVADGGYLYTDVYLKDTISIDKSYERIKYILGRYEIDAKTFYKDSADNNDNFINEELKYMSKLTHNLLKRIDYNKVAKKRSENFKYLYNEFLDINKLKLCVPYGAFMYPLYIENGRELKKFLIENKIFVPTLWNDVYEITDENSIERKLTDNIVPLPCDQRYDINDMKIIINKVRRWL